MRVFQYNGFPTGEWLRVEQIVYGQGIGSYGGCSVSLSADGSRLAVGECRYNLGLIFRIGQVRVYQYEGSPYFSWLQIGSSLYGENLYDGAGYSSALSADGNRLAVGAPYNDGNGTDSGLVRVYSWEEPSWVRLGSDIHGEAAYDIAGASVALSADGSVVAIGAPYNDGNGASPGHARVYRYHGFPFNDWVQVGQDIDGESAGDYAGVAVALSDDGTRLAVGADSNDGNGDTSGQVRTFAWRSPSWVQIGSDIDGEAPGDSSGFAVALDAAGYRVACGAPLNDGNGDGSGHVRVYSLELFSDGFESGDTTLWSVTSP